MFSPECPELPDIEFKSQGLKDFIKTGFRYEDFKGTGLRFSACSSIKLLFSNLVLILLANNPTHMYLSDLRLYFKVEMYFRVT